MRRDYRGKTILVTGAGGGLGRALCQRFHKAGARVGGLDLDAESLNETFQSLSGPRTCSRVCDITREDEVRVAVREIGEELGPVDVLINNAGITHLRNFGTGETAAIRRVVEVNFFGAVYTTAAALESLRAQRGQIIVLSSVAGYAPLVARTGYCASKHALHGFFNTLRAELCDDGVDVLIVCPSYINTGIRRQYDDPNRSEGKGQTVGTADSPESVADQIFAAAARGRREITTGRVGFLSWWAWRFAPRLYERGMLRRIRNEP